MSWNDRCQFPVNEAWRGSREQGARTNKGEKCVGLLVEKSSCKVVAGAEI